MRQNGITVASGDGPFFDIVREAQHYAGIYRQDGPVRVTVRRLKDPEQTVISAQPGHGERRAA